MDEPETFLTEPVAHSAPPLGPAIPLRLATAVLDVVQESILITGAELDPPGPRILYVNPAFSTMTGYRASEVVGKTPRILQGPKTDRVVLDRIRERLSAGQEFQGETTNYRADGTSFRIGWYIRPIFENGRPRYFVAVQRDVTEEWQVRERARSLTLALEQLGDGALILDRAGVVRFANAAWERLAGGTDGLPYDPDESLSRLQPAGATYRSVVRETLRTQRPWQGEATLRGADEEVQIAMSLNTLRADDGRVDGFVLVVRDETEKRRVDAAAAALNLNENAGFLFSGVRHELGNPVNSIKSALTVVRENLSRFPEEKTASYLDRVLSEIGRIEYLLDSLRSYNSLERPETKPLNLDDYFESIEALLRRDLEARGVQLEVVSQRGLSVLADPRALNQVLINLVANAADAMSESRRKSIAITARRRGREIEVVVADTGPGIPPQILDSIFQPFRTTKRRGSGMGLVICDSLVVQMGGKIEAHSTAGRGAYFRIRLVAV
ncbi:MAG: ATP-binding protein [Myxococcota bacterium]